MRAERVPEKATLCRHQAKVYQRSRSRTARFKTYLNNLVASDQLVDVFSRSSIEQQAGEVERTLPGLEAALVDTRPKVRVFDLINDFIVLRAFLQQLHADVVEITSGKEQYTPRRRFYPDGAVAKMFG